MSVNPLLVAGDSGDAIKVVGESVGNAINTLRSTEAKLGVNQTATDAAYNEGSVNTRNFVDAQINQEAVNAATLRPNEKRAADYAAEHVDTVMGDLTSRYAATSAQLSEAVQEYKETRVGLLDDPLVYIGNLLQDSGRRSNIAALSAEQSMLNGNIMAVNNQAQSYAATQKAVQQSYTEDQVAAKAETIRAQAGIELNAIRIKQIGSNTNYLLQRAGMSQEEVRMQDTLYDDLMKSYRFDREVAKDKDNDVAESAILDSISTGALIVGDLALAQDARDPSKRKLVLSKYFSDGQAGKDLKDLEDVGRLNPVDRNGTWSLKNPIVGLDAGQAALRRSRYASGFAAAEAGSENTRMAKTAKYLESKVPGAAATAQQRASVTGNKNIEAATREEINAQVETDLVKWESNVDPNGDTFNLYRPMNTKEAAITVQTDSGPKFLFPELMAHPVYTQFFKPKVDAGAVQTFSYNELVKAMGEQKVDFANTQLASSVADFYRKLADASYANSGARTYGIRKPAMYTMKVDSMGVFGIKPKSLDVADATKVQQDFALRKQQETLSKVINQPNSYLRGDNSVDFNTAGYLNTGNMN